MSLSIAGISSAKVKKCARQIDALLTQCKVNSMARGSGVYLKLYCNADGEICGEMFEGDVSVSSDVLGSSSVNATFITSSGSSYELSEQPVCISFNRDTGALSELDDVTANGGIFSDGVNLSSITVSGGATVTITLVAVTGYHSIGG